MTLELSSASAGRCLRRYLTRDRSVAVRRGWYAVLPANTPSRMAYVIHACPKGCKNVFAMRLLSVFNREGSRDKLKILSILSMKYFLRLAKNVTQIGRLYAYAKYYDDLRITENN